MVWILQCECPSASEVSVFVFASKDDAYQDAVSDIQNIINDDWDMEELDQAEEAKVINDFVSAGRYGEAVDYWNGCELNTDGNYPRFFGVSNNSVRVPDVPVVFPESHFLALLPEEDDEEEETFEDQFLVNPQTGGPYVATVPGATCRGPSCGTVSSDAYADRQDGTYLCYSCKMMIAVFGGINKP